MLIDTHCHINIMVKKEFDRLLTETELQMVPAILDESKESNVLRILNVGTSLIESKNCIELARRHKAIYASIGIHPNDLTDTWEDDLKELETFLQQAEELEIVAIGECGMDKHYPSYNIERQQAAFKRQIELALKYNKALVVHTRDAPDETLRCLELYKNQGLKGTIHCFSENLAFAQEAISYGFVLGIGGTVTYPKNDLLRSVVKTVGIESLILETDAPFLPPQTIRGQQNHPRSIKLIAEYSAQLLNRSLDEVSQKTTEKAQALFNML